MAQADYIISNQTFPNTRADINNHLSAIATNNSGTSAPTTQYAGQFWIDTTTTTWTLYIHDGTDDIQFATIDTSANTVNFTDSSLSIQSDPNPTLGANLDLNSNDITGTGNINITGTVTADGVSLGDNDKAQFGAGNDLQIYHNGSNSYIEDAGTGDLIMRTNGNKFRVDGAGGTPLSAEFYPSTSVNLYYNNSKKFETTSTGIDVTGKTTTDSIDAVGGQSGSTPIIKIENSVGDNLVSFKRTTGTPSDEYAIGADSASMHFKNSTLSTYIMSLSEGGDISFYEDTGTTPKFFWDASEERLGIGTSSPFGPLHLIGGVGGPSTSGNMADVGFIVNSSSGGRAIQIGTNSTDSFNFIQSAYVNGTNVPTDLAFFIGASERMRITSSGVTITGSLSKSSGSFQIPHPLPEKTNTHNLVHSFVEAPQADNIYRGKIDLVNGTATVNIDTVAGMTEGTFVLLNREIQCFTSNETGWTAVKGSVSENILTITAQDETCTDTISWLVIGERQDQHMYDTEWTDENGKVIVEPLKPVEEETIE